MSAEPETSFQPVSPRTAEQPMAFNFGEFKSGAFRAWGWFLLFSLPALALAPFAPALSADFSWAQALIGVFYLIPIGFPFVVLPSSIGALLVWSPFAYLLGLALRRKASVSVHVVAFAIFGIGTGVATAVIASVALNLPAPMMIGFVVASGIAVPLAWYRTARRALENDEIAAASVDAVPALPED